MPRIGSTRGTTRQTIYQFVTQFQQTRQYAPTIREICAATGIRSTSTVHGHVRRMIRDGLLTQMDFHPRTLCAVTAMHTEKPNG